MNNKKGIILSGLVYTLFVFFLLLIVSLLMVLWSRQTAINKIKEQANEIYSLNY